MNQEIIDAIRDSISVKEDILRDPLLLEKIEIGVEKIVNTYQHSGKVFFCGNGGSAADAQHLAAELSGRFYYDRPPLMAEALHVNTSFVTAVANDYGYDYVFARMMEACSSKGDILIALSTSGNSQGIINCMESAQKKGVYIIGLTGKTGGRMAAACNLLLNIPSTDTPRIQESHILIGHIICQHVEQRLFPRKHESTS
jgi:D-sedoheptulose 7-phosphate isomerase